MTEYEFKGNMLEPSPKHGPDMDRCQAWSSRAGAIQTALNEAEAEIKRLQGREASLERGISGMEESRQAGLRQNQRLREDKNRLHTENNEMRAQVGRGDALLRELKEQLESLMPVINDALLPPESYPTEEARVIFTEILPNWWETFLGKNLQYSKVQNDTLGPKGVFPDIHRKTGALRRLIWEGEEQGTGDGPRTIINDLIGHLFLLWFLLGPVERPDIDIKLLDLSAMPPELLEYILTQAEADATPADAEVRDDLDGNAIPQNDEGFVADGIEDMLMELSKPESEF